MEATVIEGILKSHEEFVKKVQKQMESIRRGGASSSEVSIKGKEEHLLRFKGRLESATKTRQEVIRRYDEEIRGHKQMISRLEKDIQEDKKALERVAAEAAKRTKEKGKSPTT